MSIEEKRDFSEEKRMLPAFPRTLHLPHKPNATIDDIVALEAEAKIAFSETVTIEEKIDGASIGITIKDDHPVIRNRDHILRKGYVKDTPAKKQFSSVWSWFYNHREQLEGLLSHGTWSIYGEWMVGRHGMAYDSLPNWFIPYDIYDYHHRWFLGPQSTKGLFKKYGFTPPPVLFKGRLETSEDVEALTHSGSQWGSGEVEGVYIRVGSEVVKQRFKMIRGDFERGLPQFDKEGKLVKNKLAPK